jgi:sugar/nucleoside kinase (ribokinase family)
MTPPTGPDLIAVGDVMLDVAVAASELAPGGDVHGRVRVRPGGSATNAAVWAAWAGARVRLHGRVGADLAGRLVTEAVSERGVRSALAVDGAAPTGTMLVVSQAGERSMVADPGANSYFEPNDLPAELGGGAVLLSAYLLFHHGSEEAAFAALDRARAKHVAVDAASWPLVARYGTDRFFVSVARANVLLANRREAEVLSGATDTKAAQSLGERFPLVCVKLGSEGAVMVREGGLISASAEVVEEVDPTGAGDAFDGVFLASLARGSEPEEALVAACHAGALAVASPDPWPAR